ncbi:restriction endonuclease subunit S [Microbulbifer thermotolerans]|uniref:restriction endonuclease subunit S n=1 Tax=Microbulbifer thermotolerans TaxID=252514 RepID=UPI00224A9224|nr:restriction endonuclease subunit S [Microbulbifer thermotolerans]MCX2781094.1 restriction endonuclease subunit S [Microbulbifer thermotolerans]MCX2804476.1 restriction endonuclease subunit S [Microbulbifer thermotolerans]
MSQLTTDQPIKPQDSSASPERPTAQPPSDTQVAEASAKYLAKAAENATPVSPACPPGYKLTEVGVIPEDWEVITLGSVFNFKNGLNKEKHYFGHGTPIVNYMDVYETGGILAGTVKGKVCVSQAEKKNYSARLGDVFFTRTSETVEEIGLASVLLDDIEDAVFSGFVLRARQTKEIFIPLFMKYCFRAELTRRQIQSTASYTTRALTNGSLLSSIHVSVPSKKEQTAIANALSDMDALIAGLEKLIAKKQAIKTATMQQLLTGRTRLPPFAFKESALREDGTHTNSSGTNLDAGTGGPKGEGQDGLRKGYKQSELGEIPEDWEVRTVFELAGAQKSLFDDGDWIEAEHITNKGIRLIQTGNIGVGRYVEKDAKKYIFEESFEKLQCKELYEGDLLICRLAEPAGRACILPDLGEEKVITSVDVTIFRPSPDMVSREFYNQYFSSSNWFRSVLEQVGGTTHKRISRGALGKISVIYPNLEEQTAIATILSDMDEEIQALQQRLEKTRQIKQGMMQELLTGRTRLVKPEQAA